MVGRKEEIGAGLGGSSGLQEQTVLFCFLFCFSFK